MRFGLRWATACGLSLLLGLSACGGGGGSDDDGDSAFDSEVALVEPDKTYLSGGGLIPLDTSAYNGSGTPSAEVGGKPATLIEFGGYYWVMLPALDSGRHTLTLRDAQGSWSTPIAVSKPAVPADPLAYLDDAFANAKASIDGYAAGATQASEREYYEAMSAKLAEARAGLPALSAADQQAMAAFLVANPELAATLAKASSYDARCEAAMKLFVANVVAQVYFVGATGAGLVAYAVNFISTTAGKYLAQLAYSLKAAHDASSSPDTVQNIIDACIDENQLQIEDSDSDSAGAKASATVASKAAGDPVLEFRPGSAKTLRGFNTVPSDLRTRVVGLVDSARNMLATLSSKAAELFGREMPASLARLPAEPKVPATAAQYRLGRISSADVTGTLTPGSGNALVATFDYAAGKGSDQPLDFTFTVIRNANNATVGSYRARLAPRIIDAADRYVGTWQGAGVYGCHLYYAYGNFTASYDKTPPGDEPRDVTLLFEGVARRDPLDMPQCAGYSQESWGVSRTMTGTASGNTREFTVEGGDLLGLDWPTTARGYLTASNRLTGTLEFHPGNGGESRNGNFDAAPE